MTLTCNPNGMLSLSTYMCYEFWIGKAIKGIIYLLKNGNKLFYWHIIFSHTYDINDVK